MDVCTQAEADLLWRNHARTTASLADNILGALRRLEEGDIGYRITRLGHSLQSASRAWRDGADDDWVVAALIHDIGDELAPFNHDEYAAAIIRPFVREQCAWCVAHHATFQMAHPGTLDQQRPEAREAFRDSPYFDDCAAFCARWDQPSFDPDYATLPLEFFEPILRGVLARRPRDPDVIRPGARAPLVRADVAATR
jgi:predicted HD phosphohydrolase